MKYSYDENTSPWIWRMAQASDIADMLNLTETYFQGEIEGIFTPNRYLYCYNLEQSILNQTYFHAKEQLLVARDKTSNKLLAYSWLGREGQTLYAHEELAEARFIHLDLTLSARKRITLTAQILQFWQAWCYACNIPVLVSTSIRTDQGAFMRLHQELGFTVRGSLAYLRINLNKEQTQ